MRAFVTTFEKSRLTWIAFAAAFGCVFMFQASASAAGKTCESIFQTAADVDHLRFQTARLKLRPLAMEDAETLYRIESNPAVRPMLGPESASSAKAVQAYVSRLETDRKGFRHDDAFMDLAIIYNEEMIGSVSARHMRWQRSPVDVVSVYTVGYLLDPAWHGKGLANEAVGRVLDFLFEEGKAFEIQASLFASNTPSANLLKKNGFVQIESDSEAYLTFLLTKAARRNLGSAPRSHRPVGTTPSPSK